MSTLVPVFLVENIFDFRINVRADYSDDANIREVVEFDFPVDSPLSDDFSAPLTFTEEENLEMLKLPRKERKSFRSFRPTRELSPRCRSKH